jgi:hypothetical protein
MCQESNYAAWDSQRQHIAENTCGINVLSHACVRDDADNSNSTLSAASLAAVWSKTSAPQLTEGFLWFAVLAVLWSFCVQLFDWRMLWRAGFQLAVKTQLRVRALARRCAGLGDFLSCRGRYSAIFANEVLFGVGTAVPLLIISFAMLGNVRRADLALWSLCSRAVEPNEMLPCANMAAAERTASLSLVSSPSLATDSITNWVRFRAALPYLTVYLTTCKLSASLAYSAILGDAAAAFRKGEGADPRRALRNSALLVGIVGVLLTAAGGARNIPIVVRVGVMMWTWMLLMLVWLLLGYLALRTTRCVKQLREEFGASAVDDNGAGGAQRGAEGNGNAEQLLPEGGGDEAEPGTSA